MKKYVYLLLGVLLFVISCTTNKSSNENIKTIELSDSLKVDSLTLLIKSNHKNAVLYAERSNVNYKLGNIETAISDLQLANALDSLNPDYFVKLADLYLQMGKSEEVNRILLKGNKLVPNNNNILYRLGNLYFYIQDYKNSMKYLNESKEIDPYFAPVYFTKALVLKELGDTAQAVKNLQIAVEREPDYYDAYMQLGLLYSLRPDSIAIDYYNNALALDPTSYEAFYGKAFFYQQNDKPEMAIAIYKQMLNELSNNLPVVHFNLGYIEMIYYANYKDALAYFDSSIMFSNIYPDAYCNKAFCLEKLGNKTEARKAYKKALELVPNFEIAIIGLNRLDKK
ncbi:MAG: tetratricopeptide repeat protein [Salinivirgaceae bacterium]|nr:tetratricopeptide repeat protein [Salinivirgaceae bacterium]